MNRDACCFRQGVEDARKISGNVLLRDEQEGCFCIKGRSFAAHRARKLHGDPFEEAEAVDGLCEVVETVLQGVHDGLVWRGRGGF